MRQYSGKTMTEIRKRFRDYFDTEAAFNAYYEVAFNVATAKGVWLDVWGRIIGQTRFLKMTAEQQNFGFQEADEDPTRDNYPCTFDNGTFFDTEGATYNYRLDDDSYRLLLRMKAFSNLAQPTIPALNMMLMTLFGSRGKVYTVDLGDMEIRVVFTFPLKSFEVAVLEAGVVPHPGGVHVNLQFLSGDQYFGFRGSEFQPFNVAPFYSAEEVNVA